MYFPAIKPGFLKVDTDILAEANLKQFDWKNVVFLFSAIKFALYALGKVLQQFHTLLMNWNRLRVYENFLMQWAIYVLVKFEFYHR